MMFNNICSIFEFESQDIIPANMISTEDIRSLHSRLIDATPTCHIVCEERYPFLKLRFFLDS